MAKAIPQDGKKQRTSGSWLKELVIIFVCALAIALVVKSFLIDSRIVPSSSMYPTIEVGDRVLMWRLAYAFGGEPERGDIVVFEAPEELNESSDLIKRIIGLPGETIEIKNGAVYIDGEILDEADYQHAVPQYEYGPVTIPEDCYFMLGDNRNKSIDSHEWDSPFIPIDDIKGKAIFRYWPISRMGGN